MPETVVYPKSVPPRKSSRVSKNRRAPETVAYPKAARSASRRKPFAKKNHHAPNTIDVSKDRPPPRADWNLKSNKHMEFWIRGASVGFGGMAYLMTLIDTEKAVQVGTAASFAIGVLYPRSAGVRFPRGGARRDARRLGGTPSTAT